MRKFPLGEVLFLKQKKSLEGVGDFFLFPLVKQLVDFLNSSRANEMPIVEAFSDSFNNLNRFDSFMFYDNLGSFYIFNSFNSFDSFKSVC